MDRCRDGVATRAGTEVGIGAMAIIGTLTGYDVDRGRDRGRDRSRDMFRDRGMDRAGKGAGVRTRRWERGQDVRTRIRIDMEEKELGWNRDRGRYMRQGRGRQICRDRGRDRDPDGDMGWNVSSLFSPLAA